MRLPNGSKKHLIKLETTFQLKMHISANALTMLEFRMMLTFQ
jgi:ribosomal protein L28